MRKLIKIFSYLSSPQESFRIGCLKIVETVKSLNYFLISPTSARKNHQDHQSCLKSPKKKIINFNAMRDFNSPMVIDSNFLGILMLGKFLEYVPLKVTTFAIITMNTANLLLNFKILKLNTLLMKNSEN